MNCPIDNSVLVMSDRNGIEIDYCPQCRGVWLDRGELDKIIERADTGSPQPDRRTEQPDHQVRSERIDYDRPHHKRKKKESFLSDLFEFGD